MSDPTARHAAYLAALDRQIAQACDITPTPWSLVGTSTVYMNGRAGFNIRSRGEPGIRLTLTSWPTDAELIVAAVNAFVAQAEGRRSILVRHAPERDRFEGYYVCAAHPEIGRWEDCPDYRDAAAGLPEESADG